MSERNALVSRTVQALRRSNGLAGSESVRYVALGDSVTAGWLEHGVLDSDAAYPALFRTRLAALFPHAMLSVVNSGLGGENSAGVLERIERDCLRHEPHLVTLCIGLNDMRGGKEALAAYKENLFAIVRRLKPVVDLILITPNTRWDALEDDGLASEYVRAVRQTARTENVGLADVNAIYMGAIRMGAHPADLLSNRVSHPTRAGHQIFVNALMEFFQP